MAKKSKEIHRTPLGALVRGCGIEWLESAPPGSVDLVFADPPYGIGKGEWDRFGSLEGYVAWSRHWIAAAHAALSPRGTLYVMGFSEILAHVLAAVSGEWAGARWLVWHYRNKANLRDDWGRSHESAIHLRKSKDFTFNVDPVRIPYNGHTTKYPARRQAATSQYGSGGREWAPHPLGAKPRDVIEVPVLANGTPEKTEHPTQKPLELVRRFVLASSNPGDLVVDPFAGSGTTAVVAEALGRRWTACETNAGFYRIAKARLASPGSFLGSQADEAAAAKRRARLKGD